MAADGASMPASGAHVPLALYIMHTAPAPPPEKSIRAAHFPSATTTGVPGAGRSVLSGGSSGPRSPPPSGSSPRPPKQRVRATRCAPGAMARAAEPPAAPRHPGSRGHGGRPDEDSAQDAGVAIEHLSDRAASAGAGGRLLLIRPLANHRALSSQRSDRCPSSERASSSAMSTSPPLPRLARVVLSPPSAGKSSGPSGPRARRCRWAPSDSPLPSGRPSGGSRGRPSGSSG